MGYMQTSQSSVVTDAPSRHTCHWPGCGRSVPPRMWGCRPHWFSLPKSIRDDIWRTYVPGQEVSKTPSQAYLAAACRAREFAMQRKSTKS